MRRHLAVVSASASFLAVLATATAAAAAGMDPTPERLYNDNPNVPAGLNYDHSVYGGACQYIAANPEVVLQPPFAAVTKGQVPTYPCLPNNTAWANLMSELGYAIAPNAFHSARTTGLGGFALSIEASFAHINADGSTKPFGDDQQPVKYWHQGTQGSVDQANHQFSTVDNSPDSVLQIYSIKARKGLAYGVEVTGALGYVSNTTLWVGGADVRWAFLEGFRTGVFGYLPDLAVGGGVRTLGGSPKFFLTTVGIDAQASKPIALADSAVITPYLGYQRLIIFADSTVVDLTPNVDPMQQCGWMGTNTPDNPNQGPNGAHAPYDGQPVCRNKLSNGAPNNADFNNNVTFKKARIHRHRGIAGLSYRYEVMWLAGQFATDLTDPSEENGNIGVTGEKQWTVSVEAGVFF